MKIINLLLATAQRIKYTDIVTITRTGKRTQKKTIQRNTDGVYLKSGTNEVSDSKYDKIKESPWFKKLELRGDISVDGLRKTPKLIKPLQEEDLTSKSSVSTEVKKSGRKNSKGK